MQLKLVSCLALVVCAACGDEDARIVQAAGEPETETEEQRPAPRPGPEGCYIVARNMCDCAILEPDCSEDIGVWTEGCASCAAPP